MNKKLKGLNCSIAVIPLLFLLGAPTAWAQAIDLSVEEVNGMKVLTTTSNHCPNNPNEAGCIKVAQGSAATIHYVLPANERCGTGHPQGHWVISGVQISMQNKNWSTPNLSDMAASDFDASASTGWINNIQPSANVRITDQNTGIYDVWYRVQASCTQAGESAIYLDPKIGNTGR